MAEKYLYPNPLRSRERTLGEMMTELKARLGFVTQGSASKLIDPNLCSFCQEGHEYVYEQLGAPLSRKRTTITLVPNERLYDWHNDLEDEDIDPQQVVEVHLYDSDTSEYALVQGITESMRSDKDSRTAPTRYDTLNGQLELWPIPDQAYLLIVIYDEGISRFTQPQDRPCVPYRLVFLYALASAKAHYQHPDAQTAGQIFQQAMALYKAKRLENKRFSVIHRHEDCSRQVKRLPDGSFVL